jgi:glycosyltransferase involved in cell wall biosynthesis
MIYLLGSRGVPNRYGGFEELFEKLAQGLRQRGHEVVVVGTRDNCISRSLTRRLVSLNLFRSLETPLLTWSLRPTIEEGDQILVVNPINVFTALALERSGANVFLHMDGMEQDRRKWGFIARCAHRMARRIAVRSDLRLIVDNEAIQDIYRSKFDADPIVIAYGGCEIAEVSEDHRWCEDPLAKTFLVLARPEPENNILEICRAFAHTSTSDHLLVVGAPPRSTKYWKQVQRVAQGCPRIQLSPPIWDQETLCKIYCGCRAVIHGHSVGGTNPSLVLALSHGTPVFAHDNPYNRSTGGELVEYWRDEIHLADMLCAIQDSNGPHPTTQQRSDHTWSHVLDKYETIFSPVRDH